MIDLLNRSFIPITISNDDYNEIGGASLEEKRERDRIAKETREKFNLSNVSSTDVEAYILTPDGSVDSTMRLPDLEETTSVVTWLDDARKRLRADTGNAILPPTQHAAPTTNKDALVLNQTTRYLFVVKTAGNGNAFDLRTAMEDKRRKAMSALPTEDWVVLEKEEWLPLIGPEGAGRTALGRLTAIPRKN